MQNLPARTSPLGLALVGWLLLVPSACTPGEPKPIDLTSGTGGSRGGAGDKGGQTGSGAGGSDSQDPGSNGGSAGSADPGGASTPGGGAPGQGAGSDGGAADGPAVPPPPQGAPLPLPMVVTQHFSNQGWFADDVLGATFKPGVAIIKQVPSTSGPCAARPGGARGACLEVSYTPPPGHVPPATGGWVGVYFLGTLRQAHLDANPPARPGDPNWGLEAGLPVAKGATKISFYAAGASAGSRLTFRAGTDKDGFVLPEKVEPLETTWVKYSLPFAGAQYEGGVIGAFAWVWKDTAQPVTFYLDDVAWEAGEPHEYPPEAPTAMPNGQREFIFINQCPQTLFVGAFGDPVPAGGGFRLEPNQRHTITVPNAVWTGRFWGRTDCAFDAGGAGTCSTGDCGRGLLCGGATGRTPATLAEFTLSPGGPNPDFYDLSLVDGYNLPMAITPVAGTFKKRPGVAYDCLSPHCTSDLNLTCPGELQFKNGAGSTVGCLSACERFKTDRFCCAGAHDTPETCPPFDASRTFKAACPTAYSYAYDDGTSTFTCQGEDYAIWFCP